MEPGQNLLDVAARNLAAYPQVRFVKARFEEWKPEPLKFDLVISAQAFHWVPEEVRYTKTASILNERGYLAAFWNMYPGMGHELSAALDQVYRQKAPELVKAVTPVEDLIASRADSLRNCPYFENVMVKNYPWTARYSTREHLGLLNTYSDHLRLAKQRRHELFQEIAAVIDQNGGVSLHRYADRFGPNGHIDAFRESLKLEFEGVGSHCGRRDPPQPVSTAWNQ